MSAAMTMAHGGPMFLPWHREFTLLFENALRDVSHKDITVPYWDWTDPDSTQAVFQDDFMGGDGDPDAGYAVTTGPFRKGTWQLTVNPVGFPFGPSASEAIGGNRLWAAWQLLHGTETYVPTSGYPANSLDDMMMPFHAVGIHITPRDVEDIKALGYRYQ